MGAIAHAPFRKLRQAFGIAACILYDHAWGREPTTLAEIHAYRPATHSVATSQILPRDYTFQEGRIALIEMADQLALDLTARRIVTKSVTLGIGYSRRQDLPLPPSGGTARLPESTKASSRLTAALLDLYQAEVSPVYPIRRICLTANDVEPEAVQEISLFAPDNSDVRESARQRSILNIQTKHGKNALLRGTDYLDAATRRERNAQIGGHKAYGNQETVLPRKNLPAV